MGSKLWAKNHAAYNMGEQLQPGKALGTQSLLINMVHNLKNG